MKSQLSSYLVHSYLLLPRPQWTTVSDFSCTAAICSNHCKQFVWRDFPLTLLWQWRDSFSSSLAGFPHTALPPQSSCLSALSSLWNLLLFSEGLWKNKSTPNEMDAAFKKILKLWFNIVSLMCLESPRWSSGLALEGLCILAYLR